MDRLDLDWYRQLFSDRVIAQSFRVSIVVAVLTSLLAVLGMFTAVVSQWVTARMKTAIQGMMILPLIVPEVALGVSLLFFSMLWLRFRYLDFSAVPFSVLCTYVYIMVCLRLQEIG